MTMPLRAFHRLRRGNLVIYLYYIIAYGARIRVVCTLDTRLQRDNRSGGGGGGTVTTIQREIMKRKQKEK